MFDLNTKNGVVTIYAETIEQDAISQIMSVANSPLGENANIRIMPDAHAGKYRGDIKKIRTRLGLGNL